MDYKRYVKGGIWWYQQNYLKNDQDNYFPIIIVSEASDPCGKCMVTIVPIKPVRIVNQNELDLQYVVPITIKEAGYIMCNELKTISTDKLDQYAGQCTPEKMTVIDQMISQYLNLSLLGTAVDNTITNPTAKSKKESTQKATINTKPEIVEEKKEEKPVQSKRRKRSNFKKEIPDELDLNALVNIDNSSNIEDKTSTGTTPKDIQKKAIKSAYTQNKSKGRGKGNGTPIYCLTNHKWYMSMYAAMKATGIDSRTIKAHLENGDTSEINGYAFSYKEVQR